MEPRKQYIAIDLKSFYASVECVERGLDPLDTNLLVADESRTDKTICLAVSPSLKSLGIPGRARLYEVRQRVAEVNRLRLTAVPGRRFSGSAFSQKRLNADSSLEIGYITAQPRMSFYMDYSRRIVEIYLRHVAYSDLLIYSIDEVFIDATHYLAANGMTAREFAMLLIHEVLKETGITATAGIGTNLYLAKIAMDIEAKHIKADSDGVRIAELDEQSYREKMWSHRPLTDFWRVGAATARRLEEKGIYTMGDIARCSVGKAGDFYCEELLYKLFGVNAELLIDHAWGWEPAEIKDCKSYTPQSRSLCSGQVLSTPYPADKGRLVLREMADAMSIDLVRKGLLTSQLVLEVVYDTENVALQHFKGEVKTDRYGRSMPKPAHGSVKLDPPTSSTEEIVEAFSALYDRITDTGMTIRRLYLTVAELITEADFSGQKSGPQQLSLFDDPSASAAQEERMAREKRRQQAIIGIMDKYGKNAIIRGRSLEEGATAIERNSTIGGHRA